jgi:hypothetical protein
VKRSESSCERLIFVAHNGLFRIDPRLAGNKLVESQFKQYASKNDFSAAATTESGKLAVASNKGDIRLFDQIGKNAKVGPEVSVPTSSDDPDRLTRSGRSYYWCRRLRGWQMARGDLSDVPASDRYVDWRREIQRVLRL